MNTTEYDEEADYIGGDEDTTGPCRNPIARLERHMNTTERTKEFEDIIEDLGDYEGPGLVTGEMLDYLEQCHHQRLRKKVTTLPTP